MPRSPRSAPKDVKVRGRLRRTDAIGIAILVTILVFLLLPSGEEIFQGQFLLHLGLGWLFHPRSILAGGEQKWITVTLLLFTLAGGALIADRLTARKKGQTPKPRTALCVVAILLCTFSGAIAVASTVHQIVWLTKKPVKVNRGRAIARDEMFSRIHVTLRQIQEYSTAHGRMPRHLSELPGDSPAGSELPIARTSLDQDSIEPLIYLRREGPFDEITPGTPILLGRNLELDQICIGRAGGSITGERRERFQQLYPQYPWPSINLPR